MKSQRTKSLVALALGLTFSLSGCANLGVEPWEKDQFARADMALAHEKLDLSLDDHVYFSKEGTSGGRSFSGGGCGCN